MSDTGDFQFGSVFRFYIEIFVPYLTVFFSNKKNHIDTFYNNVDEFCV